MKRLEAGDDRGIKGIENIELNHIMVLGQVLGQVLRVGQ